MKISLIRAIDRFVGIPLTWLLSLAARFVPGFFRPTDGGLRRFVFLELSEMGSPILAYPAMRRVLDRYPASELYFVIFEKNRDSVDCLGVIPRENVITISTDSWWAFVETTARAILAIRALKPDAVLDLELFSRFSALLAGLSTAPVRAGFHRFHQEGLYRGNLFSHRVLYNPHQHMSANFLALAAALEHPGEEPMVKEALPAGGKPPKYTPDPVAVRDTKERIKEAFSGAGGAETVVLFNPSAGDFLPVRAWPSENYVDLGKRILDRWDAVIVITGLAEARSRGEEIAREIGSPRVLNLAGDTSMEGLFALLSMARLLITADTGPAHFSALTRTPAVVLFGPETPALYAPLGDQARCLFAGLACSPCLSAYNHRKTACREPVCMRAISVDQVFRAVRQKLGPGSKDSPKE